MKKLILILTAIIALSSCKKTAPLSPNQVSTPSNSINCNNLLNITITYSHVDGSSFYDWLSYNWKDSINDPNQHGPTSFSTSSTPVVININFQTINSAYIYLQASSTDTLPKRFKYYENGILKKDTILNTNYPTYTSSWNFSKNGCTDKLKYN